MSAVSVLPDLRMFRLQRTVDELTELVMGLHRRVTALEARVAGRIPVPEKDLATRLERLELDAGADLETTAELARRVEALERRLDPTEQGDGNTTRASQSAALRAAIATILEADPEATAPDVLDRLPASYAGPLPAPRTVRWHMKELRDSGGDGTSDVEELPS